MRTNSLRTIAGSNSAKETAGAQMGKPTDQLLQNGTQLLNEVRSALQSINTLLTVKEQNRRNRYDWYFLAVILDRILMFVFITAAILTVIFYLLIKRY